MTKAHFNLPNSWCWSDFAQVADVTSDLTDPKLMPDAPHVAPNHIESRTGTLLPYATVADDKVTSSKHRFRAGQILYSKIRPYLAKAIVADFEGLCSADMYPIDSRIDIKFLHRWILTPWFTEEASRSQGRTVLPKINQTALATLSVPVAPLNEQRRIVEKIDALFAHSKKAKESLDRIPALLEKLKKSILAAAFRGDLTKDWREAHPDVEPADQLLARIRTERRRRWEEAELAKLRAKGKEPKDDKWKQRYREPAIAAREWLPALPPSWCWASLEDLTDAVRTIRYGILKPGPDVVGGIPYVKVRNIKAGRILVDELLRTTQQMHEQFIGAELASGDLLISIRGTWGRVAPVPAELAGANITQDSARIAPLPGASAEYLLQVLVSPVIVRFLNSVAKGMAVRGVNIEDLRQTPVPFCPAEEQRVLVDLLVEAESKLRAATSARLSASDRMSTLTAAVLAKAFRGELVPQDPSEEPASDLLERIRAQRAVAEASPAKSGRRRRAGAKPAADTEPAPEDPEPVEVGPIPIAPTQPAFPFDTDFLRMSKDGQARTIADALFGHGPVTKDEAVKLAAEHLRDQGLATFQRLRSGGELHAAITSAIHTALKLGLLDRPARGQVRATKVDPKTYLPEDWSLCVAATLNGEAINDEEAIRLAAYWAADNLGLQFKRLRPAGVIHTGLAAALRQARKQSVGSQSEPAGS